MPEGKETVPSWRERLGKSLQLGAVLLASLGVAFGILLLINSQAIVGNTHTRNAHDLADVADTIQGWPHVYDQVARLQYNRASETKGWPPDTVIFHPDLGPIKIHYEGCPPPNANEPARRTLFPVGDRAGEGPQLIASGSVDPSSNSKGCFQTQVAIGRLAALDRTAPNLSNLMIVRPDRSVTVQVGATALPVTRLPALTAANTFAKELAANITQQQAKPEAEIALENTGGAARTRIGDRDYFAYIQPITLDAPRALCPASGKGDVNPATNIVACPLYVVGLMPTDALRRAWLRPPPLILIGFGLALLMALSLLPVMRLLMIGGAESVSGAEVGAMVFGAYVAASVATLAVIFCIELAGERALARGEAQANATSLADLTSVELKALRQDATACAMGGKPETRLFDAGDVNEDGTRPDQKTLVDCSVNTIPAGSDVGARQYFKDLLQKGDANPAAIPFSTADARLGRVDFQFGQVIAQTDGINKTIVVLKFSNPAAATDTKAPKVRIFLASTVLRGLFAPVLPPPQRFMVVDTSSDKLPVLFHQNRARAGGIETLADQFKGAAEIASALRQLPDAESKGRQASFVRRYDGELTQFSAAGVPGSSWVVLVYHRLDDVDSIAAESTGRTLGGWASLTLPIMTVAAVVLFLSKRYGWRHLWPFRNADGVYRVAGTVLAVAAVAFAAIGLAWRSVGLAVVVLTSIASALAVYLVLRTRRRDAQPITIENEIHYRWFVLAMIAFIGVGPMTAFWADSRSLSRELVDAQRQEAAANALADRRQQINALSLVPSISPPDQPVDWHNPWSSRTIPTKITPVHQRGFSRMMAELQGGLPFAPVYHCDIAQAAGPAAKALKPWYCWFRPAPGKGREIGVAERGPAIPAFLPDTLIIVLIAMGLGALIYSVVHFGIRSLTRFGLPPGAVSWPILVTDNAKADPTKNWLPLANRSLLVAPQQAVRDWVCDPVEALLVNVADASGPAVDESVTNSDGLALGHLPTWRPTDGKPRLVVCGLELVLRNPERRLAALDYLERAAITASSPDAPERAAVVVIAEMSPLERILDAFDVFGKAAAPQSDEREDLRWPRLFRDFTTFTFEPIDKVSDDALKGEKLPLPEQILVEELRWLPEDAIDAVLADHSSRNIRTRADDHFPLDRKRYTDHYSRKIIDWAKAAHPVTPGAAINYVRANLIEHYEHCWAASSLAERVILDAIARNSFVNVRRAVALQSLVRRGLVILDPAPRLMNRSFALYIRQAERPDTLEKWRRQQPRSPWALARLPLAIMLPVLVIGLAMAAAESGQELTALFSLLAAGFPSLLGTLVRNSRG